MPENDATITRKKGDATANESIPNKPELSPFENISPKV